jgi:SAM-dependent methyltransferase
MTASFDSTWEHQVYRQARQVNRWPFSDLVSCVMRAYGARLRAGEPLRALELGCGTGNNLAFLAAEGFSAVGIDGSATACRLAREHLASLRLNAEVLEGDIGHLPFEADQFDLIIDRAAVYANRKAAIGQIVSEVRRCLLPGGRFISFVFETGHGGGPAGARNIEPGTWTDFPAGPFAGTGTVHLFTEQEVREDYLAGLDIEYIDHLRQDRLCPQAEQRFSEFRICGRKPERAAPPRSP